MIFKPYGDTALLIEFEQKISPQINALVFGFHELIKQQAIRGIIFCTPAYCSLTVGFDPEVLKYEALCAKLKKLAPKLAIDSPPLPSRQLAIPVCYAPSYALDLEDISQQTQLADSEIIKLHCSTTFRVYMLGFIPGFAYLGRLPDALYCNRKAKPRLQVPARSVGLAGLQTGIYPSRAPGGWQIVGRTPLPVFRAAQSNPFLFSLGDLIRFYSIGEQDYRAIEQAIINDRFNWDSIYE